MFYSPSKVVPSTFPTVLTKKKRTKDAGSRSRTENASRSGELLSFQSQMHMGNMTRSSLRFLIQSMHMNSRSMSAMLLILGFAMSNPTMNLSRLSTGCLDWKPRKGPCLQGL